MHVCRGGAVARGGPSGEERRTISGAAGSSDGAGLQRDRQRGARTSLPSSEIHMGMGVPQKRLRETAQSRAFSSQLRNRFSLTKSGTQ